jgi:hypothetical protein
MTDNMGVLGSASTLTVGTTTVYTCPVGKAAKVKFFGLFQSGVNTDMGILVNGIEVARSGAMTNLHYWFSNGGAGLMRAAATTKPTGASAAETIQPAAPIYFLSAGQTIQYTIATAAALAASAQVVGVEIDLTA